MAHGHNVMPLEPSRCGIGIGLAITGDATPVDATSLELGNVGGRRNRSFAVATGRALAGATVVAAGRVAVGLVAVALGDGAGVGVAAGLSADRVTVPGRLKLDNSPGPIAPGLGAGGITGAGAATVALSWASAGAAASDRIASVPATPITIPLRQSKIRSFTRGLLA